MLKNIEEFQNEVKNQQKELRISEMNTLISQINPHFLYNTLDTIYKGRIGADQPTMKMIHTIMESVRAKDGNFDSRRRARKKVIWNQCWRLRHVEELLLS